jgi:hypothetical protein
MDQLGVAKAGVGLWSEAGRWLNQSDEAGADSKRLVRSYYGVLSKLRDGLGAAWKNQSREDAAQAFRGCESESSQRADASGHDSRAKELLRSLSGICRKWVSELSKEVNP